MKYKIIQNLKKVIGFIKEHDILVFFVCSGLIMWGSISFYNSYTAKQLYEQEKLRELEYKTRVIESQKRAYDVEGVEVTVQQFNQVAYNLHYIFEEVGDLYYYHSYSSPNKVRYEVMFTDVDAHYVKSTDGEFEDIFNMTCARIKYEWLKAGVEQDVELDLLDYPNTERIILMSENSNTTFDVSNPPKKEGTREDWRYLFEWEKGRSPETESELDSFIQKKKEETILFYLNNKETVEYFEGETYEEIYDELLDGIGEDIYEDLDITEEQNLEVIETEEEQPNE